MKSLNGSKLPSVSIGMPVFNDARFIRLAIESLLAQSFIDFELIISDDCSTDGSMDICLEYAKKDKRIRYYRQKDNIGIQKNMEFLLGCARGEYFMWAADDDYWSPIFIQTLINALYRSPASILAFCPYIFIDEKNNLIKKLGIRCIDYSGKSAFKRLLKLCYFYDDGCGYGLFRTAMIKGVHYPIWWGINRKVATNNIYPAIFYFLSVGDFTFVKSNPIWFNRIKVKKTHSISTTNNIVIICVKYLLRKVNVLFESLRGIYRGSKSRILVVKIAPFVVGRMFLDIFFPFSQRVWNFINSKADNQYVIDKIGRSL